MGRPKRMMLEVGRGLVFVNEGNRRRQDGIMRNLASECHEGFSLRLMESRGPIWKTGMMWRGVTSQELGSDLSPAFWNHPSGVSALARLVYGASVRGCHSCRNRRRQ